MFKCLRKCHHNIIHGKIGNRVPLPPAYIREVWDYNKANVEMLKKQYLNLIGTGSLKVFL